MSGIFVYAGRVFSGFLRCRHDGRLLFDEQLRDLHEPSSGVYGGAEGYLVGLSPLCPP